MHGGELISFLLGPATVALALPLYANLKSIRRSAMAILPAVLIGSLITSISAMIIGHWLGLPRAIILTLGTHSATTPVAMGISEELGGTPSLAAAFTLLTGLTGVMFFTPVMHLFRVNDWRARGLAVGTAAHGLGTARMLQLNETAGAYSGMAIGLGALITAVIIPIMAQYF
jgi:putative effector of murein hydrolase